MPRRRRTLTVEDCFNLSDAMIADVSAVVSDYLQSGKPFSIVSVGRTVENLIEEVPAARAAYVLRDDLGDLAEVLDNLLGSDPLALGPRADPGLLPGRLPCRQLRGRLSCRPPVGRSTTHPRPTRAR